MPKFTKIDTEALGIENNEQSNTIMCGAHAFNQLVDLVDKEFLEESFESPRFWVDKKGNGMCTLVVKGAVEETSATDALKRAIDAKKNTGSSLPAAGGSLFPSA